MTERQIVSLFSGYGGLDLGVIAALGGGKIIAHVEYEKAPSKILQRHWPTVPNLGDITAIDWQRFIGEHPELAPATTHGFRSRLVLTGGFPCQDVSLAGLRRGLKDGTRSGLWSEFARAIDALKPGLVVIENVRGLLSAKADRNMESDPWGVGDRPDGPALRALGAVLGDLADLGYDAAWCGLRAADAGAPHSRFRVFVIAYPASQQGRERDGNDVQARSAAGGRSPHSGRGAAPNTDEHGGAQSDNGHRGLSAGGWTSGISDQYRARFDTAADASSARLGEHTRESPAEEAGTLGGHVAAGSCRPRSDRDWGPYRPAVERWERVTGRVAPAPTNPDSRGGSHRLAPEFVEWMMGLPAGHVTGKFTGISRNDQLKALGNGVVPQQAELAVRMLLARVGWVLAA